MNSSVATAQNASDASSLGAVPPSLVLDSYWKNDPQLTALYMIAYGLVAILALFGNLLVVIAVYNTPSMQSSVNILIVNMSVGGIMYAVFVLPTSLLQIVYFDWFLGAFMCKATAYIQGVVVTSVIYTLIAIAVDRYIAICGRLQANMSKRTTMLTMLVIWTLAGALMVPYALYYEAISFEYVQPPVTGCRPSPTWPNFNIYFMAVVFLTNYTVPLCLITFCYTSIAIKVWRKEKAFGASRHIGGSIRSGRGTESTWRVVKMMIMIVFLFAFSWLPLYTIRMIMIARINSDSEMPETDVHEHALSHLSVANVSFPVANYSSAPPEASAGRHDDGGSYSIYILNDILIPLSLWLSSSNCCVNPWVYCFFSPKYRRAFKRIIRLRLCGKFYNVPLAEDYETTLRQPTQSFRKFSQVQRPRERSLSHNQSYSRHSSIDSRFGGNPLVHRTNGEFIPRRARISVASVSSENNDSALAGLDAPKLNDVDRFGLDRQSNMAHSFKRSRHSIAVTSGTERLTML